VLAYPNRQEDRMARPDPEALAPPLPRPAFTAPIPGTWLYLGLAADPRTIGPRVRRSTERARVIARCHALLDEVGGDLAEATVFETVLIPPIRGVPRFDVVVLARAGVGPGDAGALAAVRAAFEADGVPVVQAMTAHNVRRFGDTERTRDATFLLNHFTAADADTAQAAWEDISGWYAAVLGVDNSTLLRPEPAAPYALVNYVRLPIAPVPFLLRQLVSPSYYRQVRARLRAHRMAFLPLLLRPA
jgi:hypothetical protein